MDATLGFLYLKVRGYVKGLGSHGRGFATSVFKYIYYTIIFAFSYLRMCCLTKYKTSICIQYILSSELTKN